MNRVFIILLLLFSSLEASQKEFIVLTETSSRNIFDSLNKVCRLILFYEKGLCCGVEINFHNNGVFYTPSKGTNWWQYYFKPLLIGNPDGGIPFPYTDRNLHAFAETATGILDIQKVFKKYIRLKPFLNNKAQQYYNRHFKDKTVIGVAYWQAKNDRVPYNQMAAKIHRYLKENSIRDYLVFVSTDDPSFLKAMRMIFPTRTHVLLHPENTPYARGEREILSCLMMGKAQVMIHNNSSMSQWTKYLNPTLNTIQVIRERTAEFWKE